MDPHAAARHLRERASALRTLARRLDLLHALTLPASAGTDTWVGPSQFHCEQSLRAHRTALIGHALDLRARARRMEGAADQLDADARSAAR